MEEEKLAKDETIKPMKRYYLDDPEIGKIAKSARFIVLPDKEVKRISGVTWFPQFSEYKGELAYISYLKFAFKPPVVLSKHFNTLNVSEMTTDEKQHTYLIADFVGESEGFYYSVISKEILLFVGNKKVIFIGIDPRHNLNVDVSTFDDDIFQNVIGLSTRVALSCISRMAAFCSDKSEKKSFEIDDVYDIVDHINQE